MIFFACRSVSDVPSEATALSNPAWWSAMTSIYPSASRKNFSFVFLARCSPYRFSLLLNSSVSGEFRYFGAFSALLMIRPPKAMTLPLWSMIGNMTLSQNLSYAPFSFIVNSPLVASSSSVYPFVFNTL